MKPSLMSFVKYPIKPFTNINLLYSIPFNKYSISCISKATYIETFYILGLITMAKGETFLNNEGGFARWFHKMKLNHKFRTIRASPDVQKIMYQYFSLYYL